MRKEDIRAASAISIPTEGAAAHEVGTLQKRERASHEMVHVQTGRASVKQERTGTLPLKDADAEITAGASPTDADTSNSRKPANSRLDVVGHERPAKADTSADAKPIAPAVGMRERHHDRKANPPTKTLDGTLEVAHVDAMRMMESYLRN